MKNIYNLGIVLSTMFIFIGCGKNIQPPLYNWGNYVKSSSDYGMNGHTKDVQEKHLVELEKIIIESNSKDQRVPPGIYAEYAQILFETNKKEKAEKYFLLEKSTYPASSQFIDRVLIKLYGERK